MKAEYRRMKRRRSSLCAKGSGVVACGADEIGCKKLNFFLETPLGLLYNSSKGVFDKDHRRRNVMKKMIFILAATLGLCCMDCRSMMAQELQVQESVVREQEHVTKPSKAGGLKTKTLSQNQVKLSWKKSAGASAYKVYKRYPGSNYKLVHATTKTSCVVPIRVDRTYRFMVVPYVKKNDKTVKGQADTISFESRHDQRSR